MTHNILLLPGDGIGQEIANEVIKIIDCLNTNFKTDFQITQDKVGGTGYDAYGSPCSDAVLEKAKAADAVLLGAVGGPQWDNIPFEHKPERGLLRLRKELELFANLRPAICFDALAESSSLKHDIIAGLDIMIVRELTGGVYFGEPRGITVNADGSKTGIDTQIYTSPEIERIGRVAFELAAKRQGRLVSCEKANVMQSGVLWREEMIKLHQASYQNIDLSHMYADNAAMQLVRNPKQFDVIVTDNLFGDILSDVAAMLTGSLGMLPSASLGAKQANGKQHAMYEPVHGSAPDIAGQNKANPIAMILSFAMALRYSFDLSELADMIEQSVANLLAQNIRTGDIANANSVITGTHEMGDLIIAEMLKLKKV
ncbi:MAG: 3-isopropylmalate dehydrogenase [Alphaproteobacteria bacterium]|jgi:3-isopropylmalate dehydrogenase